VALIYDAQGTPITPELVLRAYEARCFPMADERDGPINWFRPSERAIITWDRFRIPRSLRKVRKRAPYRHSFDTAFDAVLDACAARSQTWISHDIAALYRELHRLGHAHSVEAWSPTGELVGGLYGLVIGGCFCGESMFHRADDAAKLCVVELCDRLQANGFGLLDCQQQTPHMARFGAHEIDDGDYGLLLELHAATRPFP